MTDFRQTGLETNCIMQQLQTAAWLSFLDTTAPKQLHCILEGLLEEQRDSYLLPKHRSEMQASVAPESLVRDHH